MKCSSSVRLAGFFIQLENSLWWGKILSRATISFFIWCFFIVSSIVCAIVDWRLIIIKNGKWEILYFEFVCRCDAEIKMYVSGWLMADVLSEKSWRTWFGLAWFRWDEDKFKSNVCIKMSAVAENDGKIAFLPVNISFVTACSGSGW